MNRRPKEAIVLILDFSPSMAQMSDKSIHKSVFDLSKHCLQNIIKQKIFAETKNEYLLIEYNDQNIFKTIGSLCSPTFDLLRYIESRSQSLTTDQFRPTNVTDVLDFAINVMISETKDKKFSDKKIALFTNFGQLNDSDLAVFEKMSERLRNNFIQLIVICDFTPNSFFKCNLSEPQMKAIELMKDIEEKELGFCYDLEVAINQFSQFEGRTTTPTPWYSKLTLGKELNALNLPIAVFVKADPFKLKSGSEAYVRPNGGVGAEGQLSITTGAEGQQQAIDSMTTSLVPIEKGTNFKIKNEDSIVLIEKEELISAYSYGQTLVPFTEDDKQLFSYNNNEKGFKIIGFTSFENIDYHLRVGKKTHYMVTDPRLKEDNHTQIFQCLVNTLAEKQMVAIVRYNWSDRSNPQMGYLWPHFEDNNVLMVYSQLPFDEDVRRYKFPSLLMDSKYCPTDEQLKSIDNLIDSMDLMNGGIDEDGDQCEALITDEICNPSQQHFFQSLYHKKMSTNDTELLPMSGLIKELMEPPVDIREKASKPLLKISETFSLRSSVKRNQLNSSQSKSDSQSEPKRARINENSDHLNAIERVKSELNGLIELKAPFDEFSQKFNDSWNRLPIDVLKLEDFDRGNNVKEMVEFIKFFRQKSIESNETKAFNEFMVNFKQSFFGTNIWYELLAEEMGLIGRTDCPNSQLSQEDIDNYKSLSEDQIKTEN